jgi:hypothetical protein
VSGTERRQWPRIPASLLSNLTASIIAGPDVKLVNLSRGGALMEVAARYPMRSRVRLKLARPDGGVTQVNGTVSWAKVASISNGKINYLLAVIFEHAIEDLATATGLSDIENQAGVSMVTDPFEDTDFPPAAVTLAQPAAPEASLVPAAPAGVPGPEFLEEDLSHAIFPSSDGLTSLPEEIRAERATMDGPGAVDREALAAASARAEELRRELERAAANLAELSAANHNLSAQVQSYDEDRIRLRRDLGAERSSWTERLASEQHAWHEERIALSAAAAAAAANLTSLEAERQQWHETRARLEEAAVSASSVVQQLQDRSEQQERAHRQALDDAAALQHRLEARLERFEVERTEWEAGREAERASWREERQSLVQQADAAVARVEALEDALRSLRDDKARELAEQQSMLLSLTAQLEVFDAERLQLQRELEGERAQWAADRTALLAEADARNEEVRAALEAREQVHSDALAQERCRFEELIAELMQAANEQQAEYQQLMTERTAAFEEQVSRVREQAEQQLAALQGRCRELEVRTEAAEAVSVALETRHREICREAERLVALLGPQGAVVVEQLPTLLAAADDPTQAVA